MKLITIHLFLILLLGGCSSHSSSSITNHSTELSKEEQLQMKQAFLKNVLSLVPSKKFDNTAGISQFRAMLKRGTNSSIQKIRQLIKENNSIEIKKMLDDGFDVNQVIGSFKRTAIFSAIKYNHLELVQLFVTYGADTDVKDVSGLTPLAYAKRLNKKFKNIVDYLSLIEKNRVKKK